MSQNFAPKGCAQAWDSFQDSKKHPPGWIFSISEQLQTVLVSSLEKTLGLSEMESQTRLCYEAKINCGKHLRTRPQKS